MTDERGKTATLPPWLVDFVVLVVLTCAIFTTIASTVVLIGHETGAFQEEQGFSERLILKLVASALVAAIAAGTLVRRRTRAVIPALKVWSENPSSPGWHYSLLIAVAVLLLAPNLHRYPWPAPDELHHLIVARNLAEYGAYASGMPPDNLVYFDIYDSVGPPVIGPTSAAILPLGPNLVAGRIAVMLYGLVLPILAYGFLRPFFGATSALLGSLFTFGAFGTVYLSRSLYGEVPAFALLLSALILWRAGLGPRRGQTLLLIGAGAFAGLAVLAKSFLLVGGVAFAVAVAYDVLTTRRTSPKTVAIPALVAVAILAGWEALVYSTGLRDPEQVSLIVYYRHLLVFGLPGAFPRVGSLQSIAILVSTIAIAFGARHVIRRSGDPPLLGLLLLAVLYVFWWVFFTPMHLPRYLWYSAFVGAMLAGPLVVRAWSAFRSDRVRKFALSEAYGLLIAVVLLAFVPNFVDKTAKVFIVDQAHDERALVRYVSTLPDATDIATRYWPAERLLNYGAQRTVTLIEEDRDPRPHDIVIDSMRRAGVQRHPDAARIGHYLIYESRDRKLAWDMKGMPNE